MFHNMVNEVEIYGHHCHMHNSVSILYIKHYYNLQIFGLTYPILKLWSFFLKHNIVTFDNYTVSQKKFPTLNSVTLSNLNRFSKFLHW